MAGRLPAYEAGVAASADRRVVNIPVPNMDTGEGAALRAVGNAVSEFGQRIEKAKNDRELLTADRKVRESLDRLRFDIEQTPNDVPDEKLRQRYDEESERIIQAAGGQIGNAAIRDMWTERAKGWQGEGALWTDQLGRKRSVDRVRAGHVSAGAEIEAKAGDPALTRETIEAMVSGEQAAIRRAGEIGIYSPEEAAAKIAAMDRIVTKDASIRFSANINEMVKQGRVAEAQAYFDANNADVDPQTRETVKAGLQASQQEFDIVEKGDDIWLRSGGNYGKAIELAAEIKDAPLRLKVEARLNQKVAQAKAAEDERQDGLQEQMWAHVEGGGTVMNAPPSLRAAIDPSRLSSIRAYETARDAETGMSGATKEQWRDQSANIKASFNSLATIAPSSFMGGFSTWSPQDQMLFSAMTPDDQRAVEEKRQAMITGGKTADAASKVFSDLMAEAKRWAPKDWKLGQDSKDARENKDNLAVTAQIYRLAEELAPQMGGTALQQKDAQFRIAQLFSQYKPGESWLQIPEWAQAKGRADSVARVDAAGSSWAAGSGIDWALWNEVKAALPGTATNDDVMEGYKRAGGRLP